MVQLQLGNNKLAALVVDTMVDMVRLEELDLSHNQLHVWPSSLGLPALKHLNLADNRFTTLTPDLLYFPNLETLDMSSNRLAFLPCIMNNDRLCILRLLNLSNNNIYIVPTSIFTTCAQVYLTHNPCLDYHRTSETTYAQKLRDLSKIAVYSTPCNYFDMDRMLIKLLDNPSTSTPTLETSSMTMTMAAASLLVMNNSSNDIFPYNGAVWIPSLRELALRYMMNRKRLGNNKDGRISNSNIPWALVDDLQFEMTCNICGGACVNEWLSAIQVKAHQTYSSVVCKVTLCSTACWLIHYRNTRRPGPLSPSLPPPTRSNIALVPDLNPFPPDSFEWIVMAATASALQRQEDQSLE